MTGRGKTAACGWQLSFPWCVTRTFPGGHASAALLPAPVLAPAAIATNATAASVATSLRMAVRELHHRVRACHDLRGDVPVRADKHRHGRAVGAERGARIEALVEQDE